MKAADVMTRNLVSVPPDATVADAVKTMLDRGVSGLFVVDSAGELAGVLTEGDLMRREELGTSGTAPGGCGCWSRRGARRPTSPMPIAGAWPT